MTWGYERVGPTGQVGRMRRLWGLLCSLLGQGRVGWGLEWAGLGMACLTALGAIQGYIILVKQFLTIDLDRGFGFVKWLWVIDVIGWEMGGWISILKQFYQWISFSQPKCSMQSDRSYIWSYSMVEIIYIWVWLIWLSY